MAHAVLSARPGGRWFDRSVLSFLENQAAGIEARFIELAGHINGQMPHFVLDKIQPHSTTTKPSRARVHVMGVAYKKNIEDVRESPALDIMQLLMRRGARVTYTDPFVHSLRLEDGELKAGPVTLAAEADCTVIVTDHSSFNYPKLVEQAKLIVDTRNALKGISSPMCACKP